MVLGCIRGPVPVGTLRSSVTNWRSSAHSAVYITTTRCIDKLILLSETITSTNPCSRRLKQSLKFQDPSRAPSSETPDAAVGHHHSQPADGWRHERLSAAEAKTSGWRAAKRQWQSSVWLQYLSQWFAFRTLSLCGSLLCRLPHFESVSTQNVFSQ